MKTYDTMAQSVLERIHTHEAAARRRRRTVARTAVAGGCAGLLALACVAIPYLPQPGGPSLSDRPPVSSVATPLCTSVMQAVYLANGTVHTENLTAAGEIPMWYRLQVKDIRDTPAPTVDSSADYGAEFEAMVSESNTWLSQHTEEGAHASVTRFENVVISAYSAGYIRLSIPSPDAVDTIHAICASGYGRVEMGLWAESLAEQTVSFHTGVKSADTGKLDFIRLEKVVREDGRCWLNGDTLTLPGETYAAVCADAAKGNGDFTLRWKPSAALSEMLNKFPDMPLSTFSDRMTVSVNYRDGSVELHTLEIFFTDSGVVTIDYRGAEWIQ